MSNKIVIRQQYVSIDFAKEEKPAFTGGAEEMVEIFGTAGPSCLDEEILRKMFAEGMTGIRINLSHAGLKENQDLIRTVRRAAQAAGKDPGILIDLEGPELRIGNLKEPVLLKDGSEMTLGEGGIGIPEILSAEMKSGQSVLLDDGRIALKILEIGIKSARACVIRGGLLKSRKSILIEGVHVTGPALTAHDRENLSLASSMGITRVMQPFVRGKDDLIQLRNAWKEAGGEELRIYAKIENLDGVKHLPELLSEADEIVIARGDLGNAVPLWELPGLQKKISAVCRSAGKPFMVVTQMLSSMEHCPLPTRAEVSDIYNAAADGASSVMVTGETAVGEYPVEVIRYLKRTVEAACRDRKECR